jgi:hypothetical protein
VVEAPAKAAPKKKKVKVVTPKDVDADFENFAEAVVGGDNDDGEDAYGVDPFEAETNTDEPELGLSDAENGDEEDDDDAPEVEGWTYKGVDYLVDPANGTVYDRAKFENEGEVVEIGAREPNNSSGKFVSN